MLYCRLIYMLSIQCVRLTIKVKVGIPESFKEGWYPPQKTGSSHLKIKSSLLSVVYSPFQTSFYCPVELKWIWPGSCMAIAREWFQTLNLIQSRQIQNKENVKTRLPSIQNGGQKLKGRSRSEEIFIFLKTILNARRQRQLMQQSILNRFIARRRLILKVCAFALLLLFFHESKKDVS